MVDTYLNFHKDCVSVRSRESDDYGVVVSHEQKVTVVDAEFVIQEKSQQRCRESGTKNVHAVVRGKWNESEKVQVADAVVTYNPFEYDQFVTKENERPVEHAEQATVTTNGVFAKGVSTETLK